MSEVARLAGVSTATVSYVVNDNPKAQTLTQATRARVSEAIRKLDYRPNIAASGLRTQRTHSIAVLTDFLTSVPWENSTTRGIQERAWELGYVVTTITTGDNPSLRASAVDMILTRQFDAVIVTTDFTREIEVPREFEAVPVALLNCYSAGEHCRILPAERTGAEAATNMLIHAGHRRIGFINGVRTTYAAKKRLLGYKDALRAARIEYDSTLVRSGNFQSDGGYRQAAALLDRPDRPSAIFCANDRTAVGVYYAAFQRGLSIPDDLSIVGYDNHVELSAHAVPAMSTVKLPHYEMGRAAVDLLLAPDENAPIHQEIGCDPVARKSVARPRADAATPPSASHLEIS